MSRATRAVLQRGAVPNAATTRQASAAVAALTNSNRLRFTGDSVDLYVDWATPGASPRAALAAAGAAVVAESPTKGVSQVRVPLSRLDALTTLPGVKLVRLPEVATVNVGSQMTEGDLAQQLDSLRAAANVTGAGIRVGVISDGIKGLSVADGLGDIPDTVTSTTDPDKPSCTTPGTIKRTTGGVTAKSFRPDCNLEAGFGSSGAEGTAILEIVHDIAPDAELWFANFDGFSVTFEQAVNYLALNCDIVIDDISFFAPPYDGTSSVSTNTTNALANPTNRIRSYVTSAGNQAQNHWQETFTPSSVNVGTLVGGQGGNLHLFQATATTVDNGFGQPTAFNAVQVPDGGTATVMLTWNDPWGASTNNYEMVIARVDGTAPNQFLTLVGSSTTVQNGAANPFESVTFQNLTGSVKQYDILVWNKNNAAATRSLELFVVGDLDVSFAWQTSAGSLLAQADARGDAISVGAVPQTSVNTIEGFSSQGPTEDGRRKPDVVATDGVSVTGSGGFPSVFFGTSASAPHVAALGALLMEAHPRLKTGTPNALTPAAARTSLRNIITTGTIDLGTAGADNVFGSGRIDGIAASTTGGPPSTMAFASGPANGTTGVAGAAVANGLFYLQPVIRLKDALDNNATGTDSVTIALRPDTANGATLSSLSGNLTRAAVNGVATFTDLKIDRPGTGYVLVASAPGLVDVEGAPFDVTLGTTGQGFSKITAGATHSCATTTTGTMFCWGDATFGELGNGTRGPVQPNPVFPTDYVANLTAVGVSGFGSGTLSISAGGTFSCGVTGAGAALCWGNNWGSSGALGSGVASPFVWTTPKPVSTLSSGVASISAGGKFACAVTTGGGAKCWGTGTQGTIGNGTNATNNVLPQNVTGLTSGVADVAAGGTFVCARTTGGGVKCWGDNEHGSLGDSTLAAGVGVFSNVPRDVTGLGTGVSMISAGASHACAMLGGGTVQCWGLNNKGQLGNGTTTSSNTPVTVTGLTGVVAIAAAGHSTCALRTGGDVMCWGSNEFGQFGNGSASASSTAPVAVTGLTSGVTALDGGVGHMCAIQTGVVKCWGDNTLGQLGTGSLTSTNIPAVLSTIAPSVRAVTQPSGTIAVGSNWTGQPVFHITDADGNLLTNSTATVTVGIKPGTGAVGSTLQGTTSVAAVGGIATFTNLRIDSASAGYVLVASASGFSSGETNPFTVAPQGPAVTLSIQTQPGNGTAGSSLSAQPVIRLLDANGNLVVGGTDAVTVEVKAHPSRFGAEFIGMTTVNAVGGIATFTNLRIDFAAVGHVLTFRANGIPAVDSNAITIIPAAASKVMFNAQPGGGVATSTLRGQPTVRVTDAYDNTITGSSANVAVTIKSGTTGAVLGGTTSVAASSGVATFTNLTIDLAGASYVLTAASSGLTSSDSTAFTVGTSALRVQTAPATFTGGTPFGTQPVFAIDSSASSPIAGATDNVTVSIKSGTGTSGAMLTGTTTVPAVNGVATFSGLKIDRAGRGYVLVATTSGRAAVETAPFDVLYGAPVALAFGTSPSGAVPGSMFTGQPVVNVVDAGGNTVLTSTNTVTVAITSGTGGAVLSGLPTVTAVNGSARFFNFAIDLVGTYVLQATTTGGPTAADSAAFNVAVPFVPPSGGGGGGSGGGGVPVLTVTPGGAQVPTGQLVGAVVPQSGADLTLKSPSYTDGPGNAPGGTVTLTVSAGAIPGADQIAIQPVRDIEKLLEVAPLGSGTIITAVFLATLDTSNQPIITAFADTVDLTMTVPPGALPNGAAPGDFVIAFFDKGAWVELKTTAMFESNEVLVLKADVNHFTPFAVIYKKGGSTTTPPVATTGTGRFITTPVLGAGGLALAVFGGGSVDQLEAATGDIAARGVWVQDRTGAFHLLVVNGPAFLRREFASFFPSGFPGTTAVTITK